MNEDRNELLLVRRRDFEHLLRSVDLLAERFAALLAELKRSQRERILSQAPPRSSNIRVPAWIGSTSKEIRPQSSCDLLKEGQRSTNGVR